ncbi:hypothetical protein LTR62_003849 [Meristemomyces frigidus]|uniref:Uncharacterized protein n=1 Tax=Meristemomyces frigidus TaxID=1508187 RepID=A0AAN7YGF6_9PEZI|nr:hypothetical protein LTR62_003849 [Meristemomyces frigidus]
MRTAHLLTLKRRLLQNANMSRHQSWPATPAYKHNGPKATDSNPQPLPTPPPSKPTSDSLSLADLEDHPENHFLSPLARFDDWHPDSDDDEDDDDEIDWDAGITDFALYSDDRQQAEESNEQVDEKWDAFLKRQELALRRSVERSHSKPATRSPLPVGMPALTPDSSPDLRDDLDVESFRGPAYHTLTIVPPSPHLLPFNGHQDLPLSFPSLSAHYATRSSFRRIERPGLKHTRTMSGKAHSWRRPGWGIYPLGEEPEAEQRAEEEGESWDEGDRGRESGRRGVVDLRD